MAVSVQDGEHHLSGDWAEGSRYLGIDGPRPLPNRPHRHRPHHRREEDLTLAALTPKSATTRSRGGPSSTTTLDLTSTRGESVFPGRTLWAKMRSDRPQGGRSGKVRVA